jgi:hypothetical protein
MAENGQEFIARVFERDRPAAADHHPQAKRPSSPSPAASTCWTATADAALVVDVGGGSTELSWVDLKGEGLDARLSTSSRLEAAHQGLAVGADRRRHPGRAVPRGRR